MIIRKLETLESNKPYDQVTMTIDQDQPISVCIQGYPGAFHEIAARCCFEHLSVQPVPADTFEELIKSVENRKVDIGIMAIENTLGGSLMYNYNLLNESSLQVVGEVYLRIVQNLMVLPGQRIEDLKEVWSHPMAIAQSRAFFRQYPHIRLVETLDTAQSAMEIKEKQLKEVGAIASTLAAEVYDLDIIAPGIETNKKNHTRFLLITTDSSGPIDEKVEKVSLCFSANHEVGSLYKVLAVLAAYNVNLTKIQSRPIIGKPWEYLFFVDFVVEGTVGWRQAVEAIKPLTHYLKVLGAYPKGKHYEY